MPTLAIWLLLVLSAATAHARTLGEIRSSGTIFLCVAGSSAPFYQANGEAFARHLGVTPVTRKLANWDQQFHNVEGVTVKEARYESRLLAEGSCDVFPNDLHINDWRRSKMSMVPYYSTRKVIVAHREMRRIIKSVSDLAGHAARLNPHSGKQSVMRDGLASCCRRA